MTLADRIVALLATKPMEDGDLAARFEVRHQAVNSTCRGLEQNGRVVRQIGPSGRIVNRLVGSALPSQPPTAPALSPTTSVQSPLMTEDQVKQAVADYLTARGWSVNVM